MAHRVTFIPGDGVGPELSEATRRVLEATGVQFDWEVQEAGAEVIDKYGTPLPDQVLDSIRSNGVAIKGPLTTPIGTGFRSVNVALRKELDLYACLRPCKTYQGVRSRYEDIDLVVVRENHEDLYAGIEFEQGTPTRPRSSSSSTASSRRRYGTTRASRSSRSRSPAPGGSPSSPSTTPAPTGARRSPRSPRPTS